MDGENRVLKVFYAVVYNRNYAMFKTPILDRGINIMVSAGHLWNKKKFKTLKMPPQTQLIFLDSGGFQFMTQFKDYPYPPSRYVDYVNTFKPHFYASMDYPCEPELLEIHKTTVKEQIEKTIEKNAELIDIPSESILIPVIQGWNPEDYTYCVDRLRENGLLSNYMAVGSLCIRKSIKNVKKVISALREALPRSVKLHGFGLKIDSFKHRYVFDNLYSSDSMAWLFNKKFGRVTVFTGSRLLELNSKRKIRDVENGRVSLRSYLEYIDYLMKKQETQTTLKTHLEAEIVA